MNTQSRDSSPGMDYFPSHFFYVAIFIINFQNMSNVAVMLPSEHLSLQKLWRLTAGYSRDIDDNHRQLF
ncbi:MAG: hypothetical protein GTO60_09720 [Gammaproteobacteria bacterium]|nr:hypothetical protein [Gammaproteobacteria bacterium]